MSQAFEVTTLWRDTNVFIIIIILLRHGVLGWQLHQPDHIQTVCTSLQRDNHANTSSLNFLCNGAIPDTRNCHIELLVKSERI